MIVPDGPIAPPPARSEGSTGRLGRRSAARGAGALALGLAALVLSISCTAITGVRDLRFEDADASAACGDGTLGPGEVCDGAALGGATCADLGFDTGAVSCLADCSAIDSSACGYGPYGDGADGSVTIDSEIDLGTAAVGEGRNCGAAIAYWVTSLGADSATLVDAPSDDCLAPGDEVLLVNLQAPSEAAAANAGRWEMLEVASIAGSTVTFTTAKKNLYGDPGGDDDIGPAAGQQRVALQRVPSYEDVTITGSGVLTAGAYGCGANAGTGVLAFKARGRLDVARAIEMRGRGFLGGAGRNQNDTSSAVVASPGDSYGGDCDPATPTTTDASLGGGGGGRSTDATKSSWAGGGGGGHKTSGQGGGDGMSGNGGSAGGTYGTDDLMARMFLGSGGGGGVNYTNGPAGSGGRGGGIVLVFAKEMVLTGVISAAGGDGEAGCNFGGSGGGGSGGSILVLAGNNPSGLNLVAAGGSGDDGSCSGSGDSGGIGGEGRVLVTTAE